MTRRTRRRTGAVLAATLASLLTLTACHSRDGGDLPTYATTSAAQTPAPTPTPTQTLSAKQQNIADAKAAYKSFLTMSNKVREDHMKGWKQILTYVGSDDLRSELENFYTQAEAQKLRQVGDSKIASWTVTKYVEDATGAGHEQVHMDVCIDNSASDVLNPEGDSVLLKGYIQKQILTVVLQHQKDGRWTVNENKATGTAC